MDEPTDNELWQRAAGGEADAFGRLYERHARTIYNYVFRGAPTGALPRT